MRTVVYFILAAALLVAALVLFRVIVRRDYQRKGRLSLVSGLLELLIFSLWAWFAYEYRPTDWPALHVGLAIKIIGWILFAGGFTVSFVAMGWLGMARSFGWAPDVLKQSLLYSVTRNPQSVAFMLGMVGYLMLWPSWYGLGAVVLVAAIVHMMILTEEEHLQAAHGDEFARYCERVPRYVSFRRSG